MRGVITDQTGAAIPGAKITLTNTGTGAIRTAHTDAQGAYDFGLVAPGNYTVTATATGFAPRKASLVVAVAQVEAANLSLQVGTATQSVTVTAEAAPVQINNANISTTFGAAQISQLPNGGGDLTNLVQTSPGAVMNTGAGYGNFSTYGLPATSNLFTINGQPDNDPFLNLNNSGPTNLLLGQSSVQQVTVTNNGYSGQYGGMGGANVNYVTKSGTNDWHGSAQYNWNGRVMNANNYFNNARGTPRPFDNANQWSAGFGGPIVKDKTFFFVNTDGLNVVLPTNTQALIPSPAFQTATLANIAAVQPGALPFYQNIFNLYNAAPKSATTSPVAGGGCADFTGLPVGTPCALQFQSSAGNHTHEWDLGARVDQSFGSNDHAFFRYSLDRGLQATVTDPISPAFNITSDQPEYQGQAGWTHSFLGGGVNQFTASANHYSAIFGTNPAARTAVFPMALNFVGGTFTTLGGLDDIFPQGRNVTQYGLTEDYSVPIGRNTWKAGVDWTMNLINDYDLGILSTPLVESTLTDFFNGNASFAEQAFPKALNQPIRMYRIGAYVEDDVAVTSDLKLTLAMRIEHHANPVCTHNCVSQLTSPFTSLDHDATVPYNQVIRTGLRRVLPSVEGVLWQPRAGLAWTPFGLKNTVLRGGFGIFNDSIPGTLADNFAGNAPNTNTFVTGGPLSPAIAGNIFASGAADNASFLSAFANSGTVASITASNPGFSPPNFTSAQAESRAPRYYEWNFEVQQAAGPNTSFSVNYVGNHGVHEPILDDGFNAFFPNFPASSGLPITAAPDARFGTVTQALTAGGSNYNGVTVSLQRRMSHDLAFKVNYTYSHALDEISNGGFLPFVLATNTSIIGLQNPYDIHGNYGNADYDIRHYLSFSYVWQLPFSSVFHAGPRQIWDGWTLSGTLFARSGLPLTVTDDNATVALESTNYGTNGVIFANTLSGNGQIGTCTVKAQCLFPAAFSPATDTPSSFGNQLRNQYRGPRFFDTDLSVMKNTQIPGWEQGQLGLGLQFYNLFNHANFDQPVGDIANPQFGTVINTAGVPTSIMGSFLGGDSSPRLILLTAKIVF